MAVTSLILHTNSTVIRENLYAFLDERIEQMNEANIGAEGLISEHEILTYLTTKFPYLVPRQPYNKLECFEVDDYGTHGIMTLIEMYAEYCVDRGLVDAGTL